MTTVTRPEPSQPAGRLDVERIRRDFPILQLEIYGKRLAYLDNAATAQKPRVVLDALTRYYSEINSNVHRGVHFLSERATAAYEAARESVRVFLGAAESREIVFTRGTTESINLVAQSFLRPRLAEGDEVLLTHMEHHSNIVPWQLVCEATGAKLRVVPVDDRGELELDELDRLLGERTKMLAVVHVSNALGTVNPVREIVRRACDRGVPVLLDGAQAVPHLAVDVQDLDCDFYAFSGHKVFAPTGIGVLYAKRRHLEKMPPYQGGGDMIRSVSFEETLYNEVPAKFEAGTPNIADAVGLQAALEYLGALDPARVSAWEGELLNLATEALLEIPGVRILGTARDKVAVVSFLIDGVHAHDVGTILDREGIAIRAGHHCTQPLMERFGVPATARASFAFYNTLEEVARLADGVRKVRELFA